MKNRILVIIICFFTLTNCGLDDDNTSQDVEYTIQWHLINVTGGIAGVDQEFALNTVIWNFNNAINILTVENNNTDSDLEDFLDSGTYTYSELEEGNSFYFIIDDIEYGERTLSSENDDTLLTINTNNLSNSTVADGFIYTFERELIVVVE